jgi:hypothetical protein
MFQFNEVMQQIQRGRAMMKMMMSTTDIIQHFQQGRVMMKMATVSAADIMQRFQQQMDMMQAAVRRPITDIVRQVHRQNDMVQEAMKLFTPPSHVMLPVTPSLRFSSIEPISPHIAKLECQMQRLEARIAELESDR